MKRIHLLPLILLFLMACSEQRLLNPGGQEGELPHVSANDFVFPDIEIEALGDRKPMTGQQVYNVIMRIYQSMEYGSYDWKMTDAHMLWSGVLAGDSTVAVGYKPQHLDSVDRILHEINLNSPEWDYARRYTIEFIRQQLEQSFPGQEISAESFVKESDKKLPVLYLKLSDYATLAALRQLPTVRYVEPLGYSLMKYEPLRSGCDEEINVTSDDWTLYDGPGSSPSATNNTKVGWNHGPLVHNIRAAWDVCPKGAGITIGLIDTGIDDDNANLGNQFSSGASTGRTIAKNSTIPYVGGSGDWCGHGTRMAANIANPRNSSGGMTGVAYRSSLVSYRAGHTVLFDGGPLGIAVKDGFLLAADNSAVKIISLSMGSISSVGCVGDAVDYAYGKGKLIFCAAGGWVGNGTTNANTSVFPANTKIQQTIAITAIRYTDPTFTYLSPAGNNPKGPFVEFATIVEEDVYTGSNLRKRYAVSSKEDNAGLAWSKNCSAATSTTAGIAALVWSVNPSFTRSQVLSFLQQASSYWGNVNYEYGWGVIDAKEAVDLANNNLVPIPLSAQIAGPTNISSTGPKVWTANVSNATGSLSYEWKWNGVVVSNSATYTRIVTSLVPFHTNNLTLKVTQTSGSLQTVTQSIQVTGI